MDCSKCGAFCCYDGVTLEFNEVLKIKVFVEENKEYFSFLPEEYIIGSKTATRKKEYNEKFPYYLPQTGCVFVLDNNACSLQARSIELGIHPWEIKPEPCWLFPLRVEDEEFIYPFTKKSRNYDAFMEGFPCGKKRTKKAWKKILQNEAEYYKSRLVK